MSKVSICRYSTLDWKNLKLTNPLIGRYIVYKYTTFFILEQNLCHYFLF